MANNFDEFPLYDPLIKAGSNKMSDIWVNAMADFYMNLIAYITQGGIIPPSLTTAQRDNLQKVQNGQTIYNTDLGANQYFKAGTWTSY
jgi:hypothetical protein